LFKNIDNQISNNKYYLITKKFTIMKKIILFIFTFLILVSCSSKWEYKVITIKGQEKETLANFQSKSFEINESLLNQYGVEGWELVDVYEITETVHPNFGNDDYVTGLQPNVRTAAVNFVFKKKLYKKNPNE